MQVVTPFLMFDGQAEAAMNLYVSVFEHARIESLERYGPGHLPFQSQIRLAR